MGTTRLTALLIAILVSSVPALAAADTDPISYRTAAIRGMGGNAIAAPAGVDALWQNPAALGLRQSGIDVELLNPQVSISDQTYKSSENLGDPDSLASEAAASSSPLAANAELFPSLLMRNFGVGVLVGGGPEAFAQAEPEARIDLAGRADGGLVVGGAKAVASDRVSFGVSAKALKRLRYADSIDENSTSFAFSPDQVQEGVVGSLDAGVLVRLNGGLRPSVGASVTDLVTTSLPDPYATIEGASAYDLSTVRPRLNVGAAVNPEIGPVDLTVVANVMDVASADASAVDMISAGVEVKTLNMFALRGGVAYGQPTAGIGVDLKFVQVDAATYAEPSLTQPERTDRHYMVRLVAGF